MKRLFQLTILLALLLPSNLSPADLEPFFVPEYPEKILDTGRCYYLMYEGGEIVKYEKGLVKRSSKEVRQ